MHRLACLTLLIGLSATIPATAVQPDEVLPDPALEARARNLSRELRCMVCQNQSIDDSDAALARDLRLLVRERLKLGDSDGEVLAFLTSRYGDFVLLRPPFRPATALLWLAPTFFVVFGVVGLAATMRRRGHAPAEPTLSPAEEARVAELVGWPAETRVQQKGDPGPSGGAVR